MPIPTLLIEDISRGLPRQAVPLRLAYVITGLTWPNFTFLLAARQEKRYEYLTGYEYGAGSEPREVRRQDYERILDASSDQAPKAELVALLPRDHFVWSDDLAAAFSQFIRDCPGPEDAQAIGMGLSWNPALHGLDTLIAECVDLSAPAPSAASREPAVTMLADAEAAKPGTRPIHLLHLSDLHFTKETSVLARLQPLLDDLKEGNSGDGLGLEELDYLVITGDFTDKASIEGLQRAYEFVSRLTEEFKLPADRCILVPGNHDVTCGISSRSWSFLKWFQKDQPVMEPDPELDALRFKLFSDSLYNKHLGRSYPEQCDKQGESILFCETGIQFLTLNSCWQIDKSHLKRSGVHVDAVANAIRQAQQQAQDARAAGTLAIDLPLLRIAVWHHSVAGPEQMKKTAFLGNLEKNSVRLVLHGDVHEMQRNQVGYQHEKQIHIVGAGSFAAKAENRPESTPRLYNVLEIARDLKSVRVYTREQRKPDGPWGGWYEWPDSDAGSGRVAYYDVKL